MRASTAALTPEGAMPGGLGGPEGPRPHREAPLPHVPMRSKNWDSFWIWGGMGSVHMYIYVNPGMSR